MCTRYSLKSLETLKAFFADLADLVTDPFLPRYNVAPTNAMPVFTRRGAVTLERLRFGVSLPAPGPEKKPALIANARAETLLDKPLFRASALTRRCLVAADGFYEWEKAGPARFPHYFSLKSGQPFFFAGLWTPATDTAPAAFCIVTTAANALIQPIHDRLPVILGPNSGPHWLGDTPLAPEKLAQLCRPLDPALMREHRVDPRVNRVGYEQPDCVAPVAPDRAPPPELF